MVRKKLAGAAAAVRLQIQTAPCMTENNQMGTALRATWTFRLPPDTLIRLLKYLGTESAEMQSQAFR